ncbi:MAG: DeoR/GlpR family DNA-binding transcription regulator [Prolixibacteraceae bacterium]|jgi:DeoR family transcriptional regulator of aga operon|nr:DeoR/GlpR family DNA-binding transcription regulator [Prolixibacteraceae bacterium]
MASIAERHKYILDSLNKDGFVKVVDVAKALKVTTVTIRKDLKYLEEKKFLFRTHGSASPINPHAIDLNITEKEKIKREEKKRIAQAAIRLIEKDDSIIVGAGSTVFAFAEQIRPADNLTVVTGSLKVSILLNEITNVTVIQLGGTVRKNSVSVIGDQTSRFLQDITCSKLFMGVDGIDSEFGITNSNIEEAQLNKRMIDASLKTIVLADSSKFGKRGFGRICSLDRVDVIITDSGITDSMAKMIDGFGIELIVV